MKLNLQLNSRRGITLVELLLAVAITVLVIGAAGTALILGVRMFGSTTKTAQEQREIKLVELALKDNLQTALTVKIRTERPDTSEMGEHRHFLYFDGSEFVMQMGNTELKTGNIQSVTIEMQTSNKVSYAKYEIITDHITYYGVVVMNNMPTEDLEGMPERLVFLSSDSSDIFFMEVPDPDDPFQVDTE
jgi:type II secretory pathway component PulJ